MSELPYKSIPEMPKANAARFAGRTAVSCKKGGEWISLSCEHLYER